MLLLIGLGSDYFSDPFGLFVCLFDSRAVTNGESRLGQDLFRLDGFGLVLIWYCFGSDSEVLFGSVLVGFGKWIS